MKLSILVRKWHKWLALIVGVQLLFWTFSGLFMSAVPIEVIKSEHLFKENAIQVLPSNTSYFPLAKVISRMEKEESVVGVELKNFLDEPTYVVSLSDGSKHLIDALTGKANSPVSKEQALKVATRRYSGDSSKVTIKLVADKISEYRGKYPVWQVNFNNIEDTTFYVSQENGQLTARRGTLWRIYDFLWMLHIMDYRNRNNFNNWLLILAAFLGLATSISGLMLIKYSFRKRDFKFLKGGR